MFIEPPFAEIGGLIEENVRLRAGYDYDFQGQSLQVLAAEARRDLLAEARRYTAAYRPVAPWAEDPDSRIFLAGHQPELFHPGVWFKNVVLGTLARQHRAAAVNLVIDSDTARHAALPTPGGSADDPHVELIPMDRPAPPLPFEERRVLDRRSFAEFGRRVAERIAPLVADPLVGQYWELVLERKRHTDNLGQCLAQARHQLEGRWGLQTLEIPQSWVCRNRSFCRLIAHLLAHLPRFRETYNAAVEEYRRAHRIRNAAHPVPDLAADGPWLEAPLWLWTEDDPQRRRLFARPDGGEILLSDRRTLELRLPLCAGGDAGKAVEQLAALARRGIKIRSRALATTLWARLVLGDLFVHGIGGAKYDQVTDLIIERFFGLKPPGIVVVSATLHLPIDRSPAAPARRAEIDQELRDLTYHPERYVDQSTDEVRELIAAKWRSIQSPRTAGNARARWRAIRRMNEALQPRVARRRDGLLQLQAETARRLRAERILAWREYGFCLYPERTLRDFWERLLPKNV
jgi:hypothetical protein